MSELPAQVSFVLATHNRRQVALDTLTRLAQHYLPGDTVEVIVVDNASTDGTADAIAAQHPRVKLIRRDDNCGSCAKAFGIARAAGEFIVFLDDDSCPRAGSVEPMVAHFRADPQLAAAGFTVHLLDGGRESSALPDVFVGCGVGLRASMLRAAGSLDARFFMQAEEYDLCFRLVAAGHRIRVFDDLHVDHLKTPTARCSPRTLYYDTRNNLIVAARYLPAPLERIDRQDWAQRYRWLAESQRHRPAFWRGAAVALLQRDVQRRAYARWRLTSAKADSLFRISEIECHMAKLRASGAQRVAFADLGKNIYPFYRAARLCGLQVALIADDRFTRPGRAYRGIPILPTAELARPDLDAIIVANTSPAHARQTQQRLATRFSIPLHAWFASSMVQEGEPLTSR